MVMAETGSGDSNYHEYIENVYVLSETLDGYEEISRTDGKRSNFFEYSNKENNYYTFSQMVGEINNWIDNNDYSWELSQIEGAPKIERWKYTSDTSQGCLVDGGQYIGNASVTGNKGVTKIIIFMYPQKKSGDGWTNLTTFKDTLAA